MNEKFELVLGKKLPEGDFSRVHALLVMPDGRVLARRKRGEARITGGHIGPGDTSLEDALRRELLEELNCEVDKIAYVGYVIYENLDTGEVENLARMVARVSKILPARPDPDRENNWIYGRELLPQEFAKEQIVASAMSGNTAELFDACIVTAEANNFFDQPKNSNTEIINDESFDEL